MRIRRYNFCTSANYLNFKINISFLRRISQILYDSHRTSNNNEFSIQRNPIFI